MLVLLRFCYGGVFFGALWLDGYADGYWCLGLVMLAMSSWWSYCPQGFLMLDRSALFMS